MSRKKRGQSKVAPLASTRRGLPDSNLYGTIELREYVNAGLESPFGMWFEQLDATAAAKVTVHLKRIELGNFSNVEPVGEAVSEKKIDWGPGYRVYFGRDGAALVVLLGGSSKADQNRAIRMAKAFWQDYKQRKRSRPRGTN